MNQTITRQSAGETPALPGVSELISGWLSSEGDFFVALHLCGFALKTLTVIA
jgi:hypothetical protein